MADWPYSTQRWQRLRRAKLAAVPLCEECERIGILRAANTVDHRLPIKLGGDPFPVLEQLASLCGRCHSRKTARGPEAGAVKAKRHGRGCDVHGNPLDAAHQWNGGTGKLPAFIEARRFPPDLQPSCIPLTIVCGPPGSGKSTYVREHAGKDDLIICLDTIAAKLSGLPEHQATRAELPRALRIRNDMLRSLAKPGKHPAAWLIISAPSQAERRRWAQALGGRLIVLDVQPEECVRRIKADPARQGMERIMIDGVLSWWKANPTLRRTPPRSTLRLTQASTYASRNLTEENLSQLGREDRGSTKILS